MRDTRRQAGASVELTPAGIGSLVQGQRLPEHLFPLLFLGVREEGLDLALVFLADLHHLGPDFLGITTRLGLFDQRFDLLLQVLDDRHELLPLLVRDLQVFRDLRLTMQQGERPLLLQLQLVQTLALVFLERCLQDRRQFLMGLLPEGLEFFLALLPFQAVELLEELHDVRKPFPEVFLHLFLLLVGQLQIRPARLRGTPRRGLAGCAQSPCAPASGMSWAAACAHTRPRNTNRPTPRFSLCMALFPFAIGSLRGDGRRRFDDIRGRTVSLAYY